MNEFGVGHNSNLDFRVDSFVAAHVAMIGPNIKLKVS